MATATAASTAVTSASVLLSAGRQPIAKLQLPHPYLTRYVVDIASEESSETGQKLQIRLDTTPDSKQLISSPLPEPLHHEDLFFTSLETPAESVLPPPSNNRAWARARRGLSTAFSWSQASSPPTFGQIWLNIYAIYTLRPDLEFFRVTLNGTGSDKLRTRLKTTGLATDHPTEQGFPSFPDELLILRGAFWQGGGSPFGRGSVWIPSHPDDLPGSAPLTWTMTTKFPDTRVHQWHPQRPAKPAPGSVIYSRYVPSLDENFSMVALDYEDPAHLNMFHEWQNDPRVAAGWNETGTLDEHRTYLKNLHEDPHVITILARFDDVCFAYFEVYWANVSLIHHLILLVLLHVLSTFFCFAFSLPPPPPPTSFLNYPLNTSPFKENLK